MNIPVAVRIIVGLALVIVAHQVLLKRPQTSELTIVKVEKQNHTLSSKFMSWFLFFILLMLLIKCC